MNYIYLYTYNTISDTLSECVKFICKFTKKKNPKLLRRLTLVNFISICFSNYLS